MKLNLLFHLKGKQDIRRIVIIATGSCGDVRPNVVLDCALQKAGYEILLVAAEEFWE